MEARLQRIKQRLFEEYYQKKTWWGDDLSIFDDDPGLASRPLVVRKALAVQKVCREMPHRGQGRRAGRGHLHHVLGRVRAHLPALRNRRGGGGGGQGLPEPQVRLGAPQPLLPENTGKGHRGHHPGGPGPAGQGAGRRCRHARLVRGGGAVPAGGGNPGHPLRQALRLPGRRGPHGGAGRRAARAGPRVPQGADAAGRQLPGGSAERVARARHSAEHPGLHLHRPGRPVPVALLPAGPGKRRHHQEPGPGNARAPSWSSSTSACSWTTPTSRTTSPSGTGPREGTRTWRPRT